MVELVIKIPEELKEALDNVKEKNAFRYMHVYEDTIYNALKNGSPLPKGHKRLIEDNFDVGPVADEEGWITGYKYVTREDLANAETIIPADTESEGKE